MFSNIIQTYNINNNTKTLNINNPLINNNNNKIKLFINDAMDENTHHNDINNTLLFINKYYKAM